MKHNLTTGGALAVLAFIGADLSHEVMGHGTIALLQHAHQIQLSYTALSTDVSSRSMVLAGPLINLVLGGVALLVLQKNRFKPATDWFLFLFASMSLLNVSSYMILSGVTNTGDLAVALVGLPHNVPCRWLMTMLGIAGYVAMIPVLGHVFCRFAAPTLPLCTVAYLTPIVLNSFAAILSPLGLHYYLLSALPATAGINVYLFLMPRYSDKQQFHAEQELIPLNLAAVLLAISLAAMYVLILGPGMILRG